MLEEVGAWSIPDAAMPCRLVLVGFMGAGKSTVGALLADRLGWAHLDFDREIERRTGRTIAEIFRTDGEERFRALEAELTAEVAERERVVLSPGGGWITRPGLLESLYPATISVWLRVSPLGVLARAAAAPTERPLLSVPDPLLAARILLAEREPLYRRADIEVETDSRTPAEVVLEIETALQGHLSLYGTE